jgi:hypothetical protein
MKGIAFLTMVFLPGTYVAVSCPLIIIKVEKTPKRCQLTNKTFFAIPLLDFSNPTPTSKPGFWIYWAVTAPLTISVLAIYLTYLARVERKHREEDKKARDDIPKNKDISPSLASEETGASCGPLELRSILSKMLPHNPFRNSGRRTEPNPELGILSRGNRREDMRISEKGKSNEKRGDRTPTSQQPGLPSGANATTMTARPARRGPQLRHRARNTTTHHPVLGRVRRRTWGKTSDLLTQGSTSGQRPATDPDGTGSSHDSTYSSRAAPPASSDGGFDPRSHFYYHYDSEESYGL